MNSKCPRNIVLLLSTVICILPASSAQNVAQSEQRGSDISSLARDVIASELRQAITDARAKDARLHIPAYLVMADQLSLTVIKEATRGMSRDARKVVVVRLLQRHAAASQAQVREILRVAEAGGHAHGVHVLWMGNAIIFSAKSDVIEALARLPGVDRLQVSTNPDPASVRDGEHLLLQQPPPVSPQASSSIPPQVGTVPVPCLPADASPGDSGNDTTAPYPFSDDFESGGLLPWWRVSTTGSGYAKVSAANGPIGSYHLLMATSVDGVDSTSSVTLTLDLLGKSDVGIRIQHKSFSDDPDDLDGIFVSANGIDYLKALSLKGGTSVYSVKKCDLDQVVETLGIEYTANFHIRLQWHDNFDIPTDGFGIDSIMVGPSVDDLPGPSPQPNLIALQAPDLWKIGYLGKGIVIGTIDSGVDIAHPDLAERIWTNPGEIQNNGVDDDSNGYIDDIHGWDFLNWSNDVTSSDPHGTETAGIAVGDGSGGKSTGMAPQSTILTCEILNQASYWLAEQYCVDNGVDVITSSYGYYYSQSPKPDYHMFRKLAEIELVAGIPHANASGNNGLDSIYNPIPFNIAAPANSPSPFTHPDDKSGGHTSILSCGAIYLPSDEYASYSARGPAAWEDIAVYYPGYSNPQNSSYWDYPYGGFLGGLPGLKKPDVVAYTSVLAPSFPLPYITFGGTSAATPQVAGALALLLSVRPEAEPRHLTAALELTAIDLGAPGKDNYFGAGRIQVFDAARRLRLLARCDDQAPSLGTEFSVDLFGGPSTSAFGWFSGTISKTASAFNLVQPIFELGMISLDASGTAHLSFAIPVNPTLLGVTVWLQFGSQNWDPKWGSSPLLSVPESITIDS